MPLQPVVLIKQNTDGPRLYSTIKYNFKLIQIQLKEPTYLPKATQQLPKDGTHAKLQKKSLS